MFTHELESIRGLSDYHFNCHIENRALLMVTHIHCKSADIFEMVQDKVVTIDH